MENGQPTTSASKTGDNMTNQTSDGCDEHTYQNG